MTSRITRAVNLLKSGQEISQVALNTGLSHDIIQVIHDDLEKHGQLPETKDPTF